MFTKPMAVQITVKSALHLNRYIIAGVFGGYSCLFLIACDTQQPLSNTPKPIETITEPAIEKTPAKPKPILDLSLDNIPLEQLEDYDEPIIEKNSALFETLNKKPPESDVSVSGALLTDKEKDESYLKSVDGAEIYIKGHFD